MHPTRRTKFYIIRINFNRVRTRQRMPVRPPTWSRASRMPILSTRIIWDSSFSKREVVEQVCCMLLIYIIENQPMQPRAKYSYLIKSRRSALKMQIKLRRSRALRRICKIMRSSKWKSRPGQTNKVTTTKISTRTRYKRVSQLIPQTIYSKK